LRKRLAAKPSAEAARRIKLLLDQVEFSERPEELQSGDVVEAIALAGAEEARLFLQELAGGAADARLTRDAKQALHRSYCVNASAPPVAARCCR
jgi:hypothetical protein